MIKLQIHVNNYVKALTFDKILIINSDLLNQMKFSESLKDGFKKLNQKLLINGNTDFSTYHIIEYNGETIIEDFKFKRKSYSSQIINEFSNLLNIDIIDQINERLYEVNDQLNNQFSYLNHHYSEELDLRLNISCMNELIKQNINIINNEIELSINKQREMYIINIINYIKDNHTKNYFILLNNLNHYLDISQIYYIIDEVYKYDHIYLIILQNDFELCHSTSNIASNYILNSEVFISYNSITNINKEDLSYSYLLTNDEIDDLSFILLKEKNKKYYYKLISERKNMIF